MNIKDVRRAALLTDAAQSLSDVRLGLREKVTHGEMRLEIGAFEQQDDSGGVGHGSIYLPKDYGPDILNFIENKMAAELKKLGVTS